MPLRRPCLPSSPSVDGPYREADVLVVTPEMRAFNTAMSEVRVSVEWLFGDIAEYFKFIDYKKNLKLGMSAVAKQYIVSALFRNFLTYLYGNTTSEFFQIEPLKLMWNIWHDKSHWCLPTFIVGGSNSKKLDVSPVK